MYTTGSVLISKGEIFYVETNFSGLRCFLSDLLRHNERPV